MREGNTKPDVPGGTEKRKTGGEILARAAMDYIELHYKEKFSLQATAGELFVNGSYLLRVFRKHTGFTPLAYHNRVRCERAKELLGGTAESISDIGEAVGFVTPAHFSHVFRKTEGCTPTEYRAAHPAGLEAEEPEARRGSADA